MEANNPSKVLHVRNLAPNTEANDLRQYVAAFGQVAYVVMLPKYQQALVEMGDEQQAATVIQYAHMQPVNIKGHDVLFTFSKSSEIKRTTPPPDSQYQEHNGEHILLITVLNPIYVIDVNVIHAILSPYGDIHRIVIFHKNGTQALAEFASPESAHQAKLNLDGKDIYDGCCTLRISYSRTEKLNVRCNTDKTRDFTDPTLPTSAPAEASFGILQHPQSGNGFPAGGTTAFEPSPIQGGQGCVLMVYNLPPTKLTCDRVFNLFCLYGNVVRVKLLASKEGAAMVQMAEKVQADHALSLLNGTVMEGTEIAVTYSKHPYIAESRVVVADAAGDVSTDENVVCKDYSSSPMNRFTRQGMANYKHIYKPTNMLFFSNCSPTTTEETFHTLFKSFELPPPVAIKFFANSQSPKKTGLLEVESPSAGAMTVFMANNQRIDGYTVKLAFSVNSMSSSS